MYIVVTINKSLILKDQETPQDFILSSYPINEFNLDEIYMAPALRAYIEESRLLNL